MEQILINLIAGALGGVGAGKASPTFDLGTAGNIISGLVGGGVLGQIATLALPAVVAAATWCGSGCCSGALTTVQAASAVTPASGTTSGRNLLVPVLFRATPHRKTPRGIQRRS